MLIYPFISEVAKFFCSRVKFIKKSIVGRKKTWDIFLACLLQFCARLTVLKFVFPAKLSLKINKFILKIYTWAAKILWRSAFLPCLATKHAWCNLNCPVKLYYNKILTHRGP